MGIKENVFDLTPEQIEMSRTIYDGKIIKCLVAPYHSYAELEKVIPFTKTTLLFPEREMSLPQIDNLIGMIVASPSTEEFVIVTSHQNIILNMINDCVRILTEGGDVVPCETKTFMANIHDIRYNVLENKAHQLSEAGRAAKTINSDGPIARGIIQKLIDRVQPGSPPATQEEFDDLKSKMELIGEPIIRVKLLEMLHDYVKIIGKSKEDQEIDRLEAEIARLQALKKGMDS